jgi:hypothetical protein
MAIIKDLSHDPPEVKGVVFPIAEAMVENENDEGLHVILNTVLVGSMRFNVEMNCQVPYVTKDVSRNFHQHGLEFTVRSC